MEKQLKWISVLLVGFVFMNLIFKDTLSDLGDITLNIEEFLNILGFILVIISSSIILSQTFKR